MMRSFALLIFLLSSLVYSSQYKLKPQKINSDIGCFFGELASPNHKNMGNMVNTCYVDLGDKIVIIDSGPTYNYAKEAASILDKKFGKKVKYIINTHFHDDHIGGNLFWHERGAVIVGHENIKYAYETIPDRFTRMQNMFDEKIFGKKGVYLPDQFIGSSFEINGSRGSLLITKLTKKSHTDSDIVIEHQKSKTLIVGDLVFNDMVAPIRDGDIDGWLDALDKIAIKDKLHIVGGHGKNISENAHLFMQGYLQKLRSRVRLAIDNGVDMMDITKAVDMSEYKNSAIYDEVNGKNIIKAYEMYEAKQ